MKRQIVLATLLLAACSKPYMQPEPDNANRFFGILDLIESEDDRLRLVFTHGMCSHHHRAEGDRNWVGRRALALARAVGASHDVLSKYEPTERYPRQAEEKVVKRYDISLSPPGKGQIDATFLVWGETIDRHREKLEYESTRRDPEHPDAPVRASLNHELRKELMNACLIDAVVYLGRNGDRIRSAMREATCDLVGGTTGDMPPSGDPRESVVCRSGPDALTADDRSPVVLIPESLGSAVLFDAFNALEDQGGKSFLSEQLSRVEAVFLVSNQLPLLSQGNVPAGVRDERAGPERMGSLARFLESASAGRRKRQADPIQLVAISDPNDLLSYRLTDKDLGSGPGTNDYSLTNLLVSNDWTYFGFLELPKTAHSGYERDEVFQIIAEGAGAIE